MSTSISCRIFALRLSSPALTLRTVGSRRAAAAVPRQCARPTAITRRGYASSQGVAHDAAKGSDLPWLIGSVVVTVAGLAAIFSPGSSSSSGGHSSHGDEASSHDDHKEAEPSHDDETQQQEQQGQQEEPAAESSSSSESSEKEEGKSGNDKSAGAPNPEAKHKSSQTGAAVPPSSADNSDLAENWDAKKEGNEEYKKTIEDKQTRVASSSSSYPSKKTASEDPREDPKKGEGGSSSS
ncbi:hypothetical protein F5X99DRAFT_385814 [Biscogniauxia marginata]|nr:hypothetical protein F5X99DRAFT_385814 [Biscogniauxia marginata]